ncbi:MAG: glutathione S-transferase family protein [Solirubrobacteraceae bacterium]
MLLYNAQVSGNCYKARLLLAHLGVDYKRLEIDVIDRSGRSDSLGEVNPAMQVPTLVLDDGRPLAESNAILWYLSLGTRYLPDEDFDRAKVLQWMFFEQYSHEPNIAVVRYWVSIAAAAPRESVIEARRQAGYEALDAMERELAPREFLVAGRYTIADIALYAYTHVAEEGGFDLSGYPAIGRWLDRVAAQPGYVPITG